MRRLFVFGCSHATGKFNVDSESASWPVMTATKLGYDLYNRAKPGNSNDGILLSLMEEKFQDDDLIIILMSYAHRIMITENRTVGPGNPEDAWWFKHAHDDWFYRLNFVKNYLAIRQLLLEKNYLISFVDPTELFKFSGYKNLLNKNVKFLPKLTLDKSFSMGNDGFHLSPESHIEMSKFWIDAINSLQ